MSYIVRQRQSITKFSGILLVICLLPLLGSFTEERKEDFHTIEASRGHSGNGEKARLRSWESAIKDYIDMRKWHALCQIVKTAIDDGLSHQTLKKIADSVRSGPFSRAIYSAKKILDIPSELGLSFGEVFQMTLFIETELTKQIAKQGNYLSRTHTGLPRNIEYDSKSGLLFIHLQTYGGLEPLGKGYKKVVTKSILYDRWHPKLVANCSTTIPMPEEIDALKALQGLSGVVEVRAFTKRTRKKKATTFSLLCKNYRGGTLANIIEDGIFKLSLKQKMNLALDILKGLESIHKNHFVHRDLHLRNYLVDVVKRGKRSKFTAVIADLGRTISVDEAIAKPVQGNSYYIAPEGIFFEKMRRQDYFYSDIYAMGCSFYKLLKGKSAPWVSKRWVKGTRKTASERRAQFIKSLSGFREKRYRHFASKKAQNRDPRERFERLILRMVDPTPVNRSSAGELRNILENIIKESFSKGFTKSNAKAQSHEDAKEGKQFRVGSMLVLC